MRARHSDDDDDDDNHGDDGANNARFYDDPDGDSPALDAFDDPDESDPLASEDDGRHRAPPAANSSAAHRLHGNANHAGDDDDADDDGDEAVFGPSIDALLTEQQPRRRRRKRRRLRYVPGSNRNRSKSSVLPPHLQPIMGKANVAFMANDYDCADALLNSILSEAPRCSAPYRTLAIISEARGNHDRALQLFMKAAEMERTDRDLWKRVAVLWKERGEIQKAIFCLSRALRGSNFSDPEALRARAHLYLEDKRHLRAADSFVKLAAIEPFSVDVAHTIAECYISVNHLQRAVDAILTIETECERRAAAPGKHIPQNETAIIDLIQLLTELKLRQKRFVDANMLLVRLRGRCTAAGFNMTFVQRLMVAICQHRLGSDVLAAPVFHEFMSSSTLMDKHRFLLWHVADACHDSGHYHEAVAAYSALIDMKDEERVVDKFLRRALCYKEIDFRDGAKADLEKVLSIHPRHVVASLHIQEFLPKVDNRSKKRKSNRIHYKYRISPKEREEARQMLSTADDMFTSGDYEGYLLLVYSALDTALELRAPWRAKAVLRRQHKYYVWKGSDPFAVEPEDSDSENENEIEDMDGDIDVHRRSRRWMGARRSPLDKPKLQRIGGTLMRTLEQHSFVQVAERVMLAFRGVGEPELAHPITRVFESLAHMRIYGDDGEALRRKLCVLDLVTSMADGSVWRAYHNARFLLHDDPTDADLLYVFTMVERLLTSEIDESDLRNKSYRGLSRLRIKHPSSARLAFVLANISSRGGLNVQRYTVGFYLSALRLVPENALICLCLAVHVLYVAMGRRIQNRNEVMPHALTYLQQYQRNRMAGAVAGKGRIVLEMETQYNLGRAMHQLGLIDVACNLYERVLKVNVAADDGEETIEEWEDLRREAAYNLVQIYRNSGSPELASNVCGEFLTF